MGGRKTFVITFIPIYFQTHKYSYRLFVRVCVYACMTHVHVKVQSSLAFPSAGRTIGCTFGRYYIISSLLVNVNISLFVRRSFRNDNDNIMSHLGGGLSRYDLIFVAETVI